MKTFKNLGYIERNPEMTNIVYAQAPALPINDRYGCTWCEVEEQIPSDMTHLGKWGGANYFGYL